MNVEIMIGIEPKQDRRFVRANPMFRVGEIVKERGVWVFHHYQHADKLLSDDAKALLTRTRIECTLLNVRDRLKA